ncbi:bifunctional oligoribonuclease/PAP phosphatase NrnA [Patescibacteria group bacterium]
MHVEKLKERLNNAQNILILTHQSIDHDAIFGVLMLHHILSRYFSDKNTEIITNEKEWPKFKDWNLYGYEHINNVKRHSEIEFEKYNLIFLVDVSQYDRSLKNFTPAQEILDKTVVIDHHSIENPANFGLIINSSKSSSSEQIFVLFRELLGEKFEIDDRVAYFTQMGIVADTNRFLFNAQISPETYKILAETSAVKKLNLENEYYRMLNNTVNSIYVFNELINQAKFVDDYCYTVLPRKLRKKFVFRDTKGAVGMFLNIFIRTLQGVNWGFVVKPTSKRNIWRVSFRSRTDTKDVSKIAEKLGGGGHINAAAGTVRAKNEKKAVEEILKVL